jgi:pimeloyl-ACP methyl ester carboxylesterase
MSLSDMTGTALLQTGVRMHYYAAGGRTRSSCCTVSPRPRGNGSTSYRCSPRPAIVRSRRRPAGRRPAWGGYTKREMAKDIRLLLHDHLRLAGPAFVLGHDIGAQLAVAYAFCYPDGVRAVRYGEAPLPGTEVYERMKSDFRQ